MSEGRREETPQAESSAVSSGNATGLATKDSRSEAPSFVVGIGASAGGLEALERFLKAMPPDSGMAFVVIQHLSPDFKSLMDELLARHTRMLIQRVDEPAVIKKDTVYLLPPRKEMVIAGGKLHTHDRPADQPLSMPINVFFRSLAREAGDKAIAVVLSGTGTDGSSGLLDVHDMGGLVVVQAEETAKFDGMPRSAIDTGLADAVLAPEEIPTTLLAYARNPAAPLLESKVSRLGSEALVGLPAVVERLREVYGIDFNYYKPATISRRIDRRISIVHCVNFQEYSERVLRDAEELDALYKDLLIGVTRFFRDPEAFEILRDQVIPTIVDTVLPEDEIRVWVPACATGEEAYSLAILFLEHLERVGRRPHIRIFASDVHRESLQFASEGSYPEASLEGMEPERRDRFFSKEVSRYRINSRLRKMLIFSPHNLIKDPPFTRMDLVSCRNLLIYFQPAAQTKALSSFHFALKLRGALFLGPSEGTGELSDEFEAVDRQWKIYQKIRDSRLPLDMRMNLAPLLGRPAGRAMSPGDLRMSRAYDSLLTRYVPTGVLINEQREVLHVFSDAERYLRPPSGRMSSDIVSMARGDLRIALSSAIQNALKRNEKVVFKGVRIHGREPHNDLLLSIVVDPIPDKATNSTYLFVLFQEEREVPVIESDSGFEFQVGEESQARIQQLEQELQHTKESLQTTVEELETSNEELQSSNEELLAANEELQSTNEELHSVNEELYSVNAEHEQKIKELIETTNDLNNLMRSTEIGTIFLDSDHCIRLFTPVAAEIFNLLAQDVGRDIKHITYRVKDDDIFDVIEDVTMTRRMHEKKVVAPNGRTYLRRVMPYWDENNTAIGLVLTFVDVTQLMAAERQLRLSEFSVNQASVATYWIASDGNILRVNRANCDMLGYAEEELLSMTVHDVSPELTPESWPARWLEWRERERMTFETTLRRKNGQVFAVEMEVNWFEFEGQEYNFTFARDITERKLAEQTVRRSEQLYRSTFELATVGLSHMSLDGRFLKVNQRLCEFLGYREAELMERSVLDITHPDDHIMEESDLARTRLGQLNAYEFERRFVRQDGRIVWGHVHGKLMDGEIEDGVYLLRAIVDITEHKQAEAALRESEERFRLLVEGGPQAIVMVDTDGRITLVNSQTERLFGYRRGDLVGQFVEMLIPDRYHADHVQWRAGFLQAPTARPMGADRYLYCLHRDGSEVPVEIGLSPLRVGERTFVLASITDATSRQQAELAMKESLHEKETLLKEIHHRVKNNMQLISSLLRLQSDYVKNSEALGVFREAQNRVRSMALIHEKLYQASSLARVEFSEYVHSLVGMLMQTYAVKPETITVNARIESVELSIETAIPLGLILNELISNSLKHAFPDDRQGAIDVVLSFTRQSELELVVQDDGVGFPPDLDWKNCPSFGLYLVRLLADQLQGRLERQIQKGVAFRLLLAKPDEGDKREARL